MKVDYMKKLKIAFIVPSFPKISETFIYTQIVDLIDKGHEVSIIAYNSGREKIVHSIVEEGRLLEKSYFLPRSWPKRVVRSILHSIKKINNIIGIVPSKNLDAIEWKRLVNNFTSMDIEKWYSTLPTFDIYHVQFGIIGIPVAKLFANNKLPNSKMVVTFHGYDLNPLYLDECRIIYKQLFDQSSALTVNTPYLKSLLDIICPYPDKINVIPVGLNTNKFSPSNSKSPKKHNDSFRILFCGRLIPLKGPDLVIKILNILVNERKIANIKLSIIGTGPMLEELIKLVDDLKLIKEVEFLGALSQENVLKEMENSNAFLMPGIYDSHSGRAETQGLVIQEAQSMELPVLVSDVGGMKYGIQDGVTGYVINEGDIFEFSNKIEYLLENLDDRKKIGKAGRRFVVENYDSSIIGDKLLTIYNNIND